MGSSHLILGSVYTAVIVIMSWIVWNSLNNTTSFVGNSLSISIYIQI